MMIHTITGASCMLKLLPKTDVAARRCVPALRSPWKALCTMYVFLFAGMAGTASGQLTAIDSFQEMTGGVFYDIVMSSPCGGHCWYPFTIDVAGRQVTVTPAGTAPGTENGPYCLGCFLYSGSHHDGWRLPRDPAADPGDYTGNAEASVSAYGDLILNFSEPLISFGFTSWVGRPCSSSSYNPSDTVLLYDAPSATGNFLGQVSSSTAATSCYFTLDFVGLVGTTPQIRSARIPLDEPNGIRIDGIAIAVGEPCVAPSVSAQPAPATTCGAGAAFSVTTAGTEPIVTQWRVESPADSGTYVDVTEPSFTEPATGLTFDASGAATDTLVVSNVQLGTHPGTIRFIAAVSNACGSVNSDAATLTVTAGPAPDLDLDCDVDADDYTAFEACGSGPGIALTAGCENRDFDADGDVDQSDFSTFQRCYSGQGNPADPDCAS